MRPEDLQARLRPRTAWEATDLGVLMLRRWSGPVAAAWAWTVAPLMLVVVALSLWTPLLAALLLWWLKPLWARVVLFVLSRSLFDAVPTPRDVARAGLWRGALGALLWRRIDPARSFLAPITDLEQLSGARARRRRSELAADGAIPPATALTSACLMLEVAVLVGVVGFVLLSLPDSPRYDLQNILYSILRGDLPALLGPLLVAGYAAAISLVEPLYVAAGFGLYLNRRTWLEGWDVELAFRRLAARLSAAGMVLLALLAALPARAAEEAPDPQAVVSEVLADPIFGHTEVQTSVELRFDPSDWFSGGSGGEVPAVPGLAEGLRATLLAVLGVVLAVLGFWLFRNRDLVMPRMPERRPLLGATESHPLMAAPAGLPSDVAAAAQAAWDAGAPEEALSLLYRGAIAWLIDVQQVEIEAGATESECLAHVRGALPAAPAEAFARLTDAWIAQAYDQRVPEDFGALVASWRTHFSEAS